MRLLRATIKAVVGLFVADWVQSVVIVAIVLVAWAAFARVGRIVVVVLIGLLAAQHVWFARAEARRIRSVGGAG